jgi:NAD(P)-dependent dehydrogenase (short-subunit alcohol dehydrogenase family)/uncharacterized protein YndB with AHSA1/START domain
MTRVVVLTGGATGIGAAAADRFRRAGCDVHVLDLEPPAAAGLHFVPCDIGRADAIDAALGQLPSRIDALVHVAGIATAKAPETVVAVNFLGVRHLTEALLPRIGTGGGVVIVASSAARDWQLRAATVEALLDTADHAAGLSWLADHADAWEANPYKFAKQCAAAYTYRAAGLGLARGIRVNCINPGTTETRQSPAFRLLVGAELYEWGVRQIGRAGQPEDFAPVIEFLALGDCPWLNGVELLVDGGYVAGLVGGWISAAQAPAAVAAPVVNRFAAALCRPDLTKRPHQCVVERRMAHSPAVLYHAWTAGLDRWLAVPGTVSVTPQVNAPWFFEAESVLEAGRPVARQPHYGRFLGLIPDRLVETTWVTGVPGTVGAETVVTVTLAAADGGAHLRLTHAGFVTAAACEQHARAWPRRLEILAERLAADPADRC